MLRLETSNATMRITSRSQSILDFCLVGQTSVCGGLQPASLFRDEFLASSLHRACETRSRQKYVRTGVSGLAECDGGVKGRLQARLPAHHAADCMPRKAKAESRAPHAVTS
jgi:hypothetical protein